MVLCFGLMRPYKGIDLLLERVARDRRGRAVDRGDAQVRHLQLRRSAPANVRFVPRFVGDSELPAYFQRADLVVLPYREIDQSGVLFTALAFGKPMLLSDVGGFPEVAATGAARTFPAGDVPALSAALCELLADPAALSAMAERARAAAAGPVLVGVRSDGARSSCTSRSSARRPVDSAVLEVVFWVCAALIVWTQVGYAATLAVLARVFGHVRPLAAPEPPPALSLIVAAHDEESVIGARRSPTPSRSTIRASARGDRRLRWLYRRHRGACA